MSSEPQLISTKTAVLNQLRHLFKLRPLEWILFQLTLNKPPQSFFSKCIPPNYLYKPGSFRTATRNGFHYHIDLSDYVEHSIFWGIKDSGHDLLYQQIKPGNVIIDIGANIGDTALHFAKLTGSNGKVFSFEPDIDNFNKLTLNINNNSFTNIRTFNIGLGNSNIKTKLYRINPGNKGMNRIIQTHDSSSKFTEIEIRKLDDVVSEEDMNNVDFIKIDVEGFEFEVIKGALETIKKFNPKLFIEIDNDNLTSCNTSADEVFDYLIRLGYKLLIAQSGQEITNTPFKHNLTHFDIICHTIK